MKARRKSDGKIIEVREWRGASDVVYSSPDMNQFYQASELDFKMDSEDTVIHGWVARDEGGDLYIYIDKPKRTQWLRWAEGSAFLPLSHSLFPDLTWDDDPQEIEIIIKRKKK